jgi:plasmid stabilization system protein ParE
MRFRVAITRKAAREIAQEYEWLSERSPAAADRWRDALLAAVSSLEANPERCGEAPEAGWFGEGLRQLLHGKRRQVYRVLFEIRDDVVVILRVRHSAQELLHPGDL